MPVMICNKTSRCTFIFRQTKVQSALGTKLINQALDWGIRFTDSVRNIKKSTKLVFEGKYKTAFHKRKIFSCNAKENPTDI